MYLRIPVIFVFVLFKQGAWEEIKVRCCLSTEAYGSVMLPRAKKNYLVRTTYYVVRMTYYVVRMTYYLVRTR